MRGHGNKSDILDNNITLATVSDIGLTSKDIFEARQVRDAGGDCRPNQVSTKIFIRGFYLKSGDKLPDLGY